MKSSRSRASLGFLAAAIGMLLVLAITAVGLFIWRQDLASEEGRLQSALAARQAQRLARAAIESRPEGRAAFLAETDDGLAGARLQQRLGEVAASAGMTVTSIEVLGPDAAAPSNAIRISVSLSGGIAGLRDALLAIEAGTPILFLRTLEIDSAGTEAKADALNVHLIVEGYRPPGARS